MYESFFGFREKPFSLVPDPSFFYLSEKHDMALTMLRYALQSRALITVITGDIGCGKSTLLQKIIRESEDDITIGLLNYTHSSFGDLLQWVLLAFNLDHRLESKADRYKLLVQFFNAEFENNRRIMLIVDEAQNMDDNTLEHLRMLSNINVHKDQVLQLVLVGQPELLERLRRKNLYQFAQRIAVDYHIGPLGLADTADYIRHRLKIVGGDPQIFRPETFELIYRHSRGVPRLINILCDTALLYAYSAQKKEVDANLIVEAITDRQKSAYFRGDVAFPTEDEAPATGADSEQSSEEIKPEPPLLQKEESELKLAYDWRRVAQSNASEKVQEPGAVEAEAESSDGPSHDPSESIRRPLVNEWPGRQEGDPEDDTAAEPESLTTAVSDEVQSLEQIAQELGDTSESSEGKTSNRNNPQRWAALLSVLIVAMVGGFYMFPELIPIPSAIRLKIFPGAELAPETSPVSQSNENVAADPSGVSGFVGESNVDDLQSSSQSPRGYADDRNEAADVSEQRSADMQVQRWLGEVDQHLADGRLINPADGNAYDSLRKILDHYSDHPQALQRLESISARLLVMATEAEKDQRWDQASAHLRALLSIRPEHDVARNRLTALESAAEERKQIGQWLAEAERLIVAGRLVKPKGGNAFELVRRILELQPQHSGASSVLSTIKVKLLDASEQAMGKHQLPAAIEHLQDLLTIDPNHSVALSRIGALRAKAAQQERTRKDLARAQAQIDQGKLVAPDGDNAFETLRQVLAREPQNSVALQALEKVKTRMLQSAEAATENDRRDIAIAHLKELLSIEPKHAVAQSRLEQLEAERKREENVSRWLAEAAQYLDKGQLIQPEGENAYEFLNRVLQVQPDNEQALSAINTIKHTLLDRGERAVAAEQWDLAATHLSVLLSIQPDFSAAQTMLSTVKARKRLQQQIARWIEQAEQLIRSGNLLEPPGSNAYEFVQKVLNEVPKHAQGLELLSQLTNRALESVDRAMSEQDYALARVQLEQLKSSDLGGEKVRDKLDLLTQAEHRQRQLDELLASARSYMASGHLVKPEKENAYDLLSRALELQPGYPEALDAITTIEERLLENAREAKRNQQWEKASNDLRGLLRLDPDHVAARSELKEVESKVEQLQHIENLLSQAEGYLVTGQLTQPPRLNAYETFEQVLQYEPQNQRALAGIDSIKATLLRSAQEAKRLRQFESAKARLQSLLSIQPDHSAALSEVAEIDNQLQKEKQISEWLKEAREHIHAGRLVAPENANAYESLKRVINLQANNSEALNAIETIKEKLLQGIRRATQERQWEQVQTESRQLLQMEEDHAIALASLKQAQQQINIAREVAQWMSDAAHLLENGQLLEPPGANAYETLQSVLSLEPDHQPALAAMESIVKRLLDRAAEQQKAEHWELAASTLRDVLVIKPDNSNALIMLAEIEPHVQAQREIKAWLEKATQYTVSGQMVEPPNENAYELLHKVLDRDPDNPQATKGVETIRSELMRSATSAEQKQQWQVASSNLRYLLRYDPANASLLTKLRSVEERIEREQQIEHWLQLAEENLKAGRLVDPVRDNAYVALRNVLAVEPAHAEAQQGIKFIKTKLWKDAAEATEQELWEQARQHLENLLLIDPNNPEAVAKMRLVTSKLQRYEERTRRVDAVEILSILKQKENSAPVDAGPQVAEPEEILNIIKGGSN